MTLKLHLDSQQELPDDAELMLITEYVGGFMTDAQAEAFEERLATDEEFFERVSPLLDAWYAPGMTPTEMQTAAEMEKEGRLRPRVRRPRYKVHIGMAMAACITLVLVLNNRRGAPTIQGSAAPPSPVTTASNSARNPDSTASHKPRITVAVATPKKVEYPAPIVVAETDSERALAAKAQGALPSPTMAGTEAVPVLEPQALPVPANTASAESTYVSVAQQMQNLINAAANAGANETKKSIWQKIGGVLGHLVPWGGAGGSGPVKAGGPGK